MKANTKAKPKYEKVYPESIAEAQRISRGYWKQVFMAGPVEHRVEITRQEIRNIYIAAMVKGCRLKMTFEGYRITIEIEKDKGRKK